jgi:nucleosome binding factor SPN SPT16 subunit
MEDYRNAGGRKVPFHVTIYQNGAKTTEFVWEEIVFDTPVDPAIFEKNKPQPAKEA